MSTQRVYVAYTGGTIGMLGEPNSYAPAPGYLRDRLLEMPELQHPEMPSIEVRSFDPLLDSADMQPANWLEIAQDIASRYDEFDGFVVLHGTDTMAYTASALPFLLPGLAKPVVLTGSQIPLCEVRNDARDNVITALLIAANHPVPEVMVLFGDRLMRGCRSTKTDCAGLQAFESPNFGELGDIGAKIKIHWERARRAPEGTRLEVAPLAETEIGALRLFPGISARVLMNTLAPPLQGLVLETYGVGNGPSHDPRFLEALRAATARGAVVVATTQCLRGEVDLSSYATGAALADAGVISGGDMTPEAALAKLVCLFGRGLPSEEVRPAMRENLVGELTPKIRPLDLRAYEGQRG